MESAFPPLPEWFWYPVTFIYGAIVGSFLNVLIYRLPLGLNVSHPPSHCPNCDTYLSKWDNVPLIAFLLLRGRCRYCRIPISWRYFSVELLTACLWTVLYHRLSGTTGVSWVVFVADALFASVLIAMIFIDLDHFIAPDELNVVGFVLGAARDLVCIGLLLYGGRSLFGELGGQFLYFGWLPRFVVGALAYGSVLFLVSLIGFVVYAREENEPIGSVVRRFFIWEDDEAATPEAGMAMAPGTAANTDGGEDDEEMGDPPRLRFSPGFLAIVSALLLVPVAQVWAICAFVVPFAAFVLLTRRDKETIGNAAARFFKADDMAGADQPGEAIAPSEIDTPEQAVREAEWEREAGGDAPLTPAQMEAQMRAEADQFAREAETGKHGGMGLGDVKLALAIGAVLGPGMALLSLFCATAIGAVTGIVIARLHNRSLRYGLPFVPFMAVGAILVLLYGPTFVDWYIQTTGINRTDDPAQMPLPPAALRPQQIPQNAPQNESRP